MASEQLPDQIPDEYRRFAYTYRDICHSALRGEVLTAKDGQSFIVNDEDDLRAFVKHKFAVLEGTVAKPAAAAPDPAPAAPPTPEPAAKTPALDLKGFEPPFEVMPRGKNNVWFDVVDSNGAQVNTKGLRKPQAESLVAEAEGA